MRWFVRLFILWVLMLSAVAVWWPGLFLPLLPWISWMLGLVMLGMGMTLGVQDFARVLRMPRAVLCGMGAQFLVMPTLGFVLAKAAGLNAELAMGMILVGACPGGTASNVITYLARGHVALSVTMTACSTVLAVVLTPNLIWLFGDTYLPVDRAGLFRDLVVMVLVPIAAGVSLRHLLGSQADRLASVFPVISVVAVVLIVAAIVAASRDRLASALGLVGLVVIVHNLLGLTIGYGLARLMGLPEQMRRTIAIEVGLQNSGLGVALANAHFPAGSLTALPAAVFSVVHLTTGSLLANWWGNRPPRVDPSKAPSQQMVTAAGNNPSAP